MAPPVRIPAKPEGAKGVQFAGFTIGLAQSFFDFYSVPISSYNGYFPSSDTGDPGWKVAALTVLYIEDNQPNVDLVQHVLQFRPGVTLLTAPNGAAGLRIARRYLPGLILLDLNLPDLQGDEVLAHLRADERTAAIPVVMVSADATQGQIDRLLAAGAQRMTVTAAC